MGFLPSQDLKYSSKWRNRIRGVSQAFIFNASKLTVLGRACSERVKGLLRKPAIFCAIILLKMRVLFVKSVVSDLLLAVVLPDPFRGMGVWRNSTEIQYSCYTTRSGP